MQFGESDPSNDSNGTQRVWASCAAVEIECCSVLNEMSTSKGNNGRGHGGDVSAARSLCCPIQVSY